MDDMISYKKCLFFERLVKLMFFERFFYVQCFVVLGVNLIDSCIL